MGLKWSEETLERFYNLHENFREHFDEERAKEITKWPENIKKKSILINCWKKD